MSRSISWLGRALAGAALLYYAHKVEPEQTAITRVTVSMRRLGPAFDGYRIVQMSDIHMGGWMNRERLGHIVTQVNAQRPDLIVITGDFVTRRVPYQVEDFLAVLPELSAPDGVVAVPGNHDHSAGIIPVRRMMADCGILDLSNAVKTLARGADRLHIAGVDDVTSRKARLDEVLFNLPQEGAALLLCHVPDFADVSAATDRFDLQLSGHTHGGQIRLPVLGALIGPKHGRRYVAGFGLVDEMALYVNRGVGMVSLPVRLNCPPEISVFTLRSGQGPGQF